MIEREAGRKAGTSKRRKLLHQAQLVLFLELVEHLLGGGGESLHATVLYGDAVTVQHATVILEQGEQVCELLEHCRSTQDGERVVSALAQNERVNRKQCERYE